MTLLERWGCAWKRTQQDDKPEMKEPSATEQEQGCQSIRMKTLGWGAMRNEEGRQVVGSTEDVKLRSI